MRTGSGPAAPQSAACSAYWAVKSALSASAAAANAARRNRARQRERAETEIARVEHQVGTRRCPTVEQAQAKIRAIVDRRQLRDLYRVTTEDVAGRRMVRCVVDTDALARAEAIDGYYVLESTRLLKEASPSACWPSGRGNGRSSTAVAAPRGRCAFGRYL